MDEGRDIPQQMAEAVSTAPVIVFTADFDGGRMTPAWVSGNIEGILGYTVEQALAPGWWWQNLHPDDRARAAAYPRRLTRHGHHSHEYRFRHADGRWIRILDQHRLTQPDRIVGSWTDITELRAHETRSEAAEAHYRRLITTSPYAIYALDMQGRFTELNPAGERLLRRTDLIGRSFEEVIAPESAELAGRVFSQLMAGETPEIQLDLHIIRPDGERRLISLSATVIHDDVAVGVHGIARDITEERALHEERERVRLHYERLVTTSPYAIYVLDLDGRFTEVNRATAEMLGRPAEDLLGRPFSEVIAPEDVEAAEQSFRSKLSGASHTTDIHLHVIRSNGAKRLAHIRATPIYDGDRIIGSQGIGRDITEERARSDELQLLAAVLDHLSDGVSVHDEDGRIVYRNAAWLRLLESAPDADPFAASADGSAQSVAMRTALEQHGAWRGRIAPSRGDGTPLEITCVRVPVGEQSLTFMLLRDVTDELAREQQLRRAERLASVATLVGGVAHELNNPLTAIAGFAELMLLEERSAEDQDTLRLMRREATRAARIVADLRLLARDTQSFDEVDRSAVDMNDIARHVVKLQRYAFETGSIDVVQDLQDGIPAVCGSASELEQVVLNLVVNARQALEQSRMSRRRLVVRTRPSDGHIVLTISDNGPGIPSDQVDRIFDPFFTTKLPGEGMGLGLSLVHRIVTEHGGDVSVESSSGHGASFAVRLPVMDAPVSPFPGNDDAGDATALRILVVDDEEPIRRALLRYLQRRGHTVDEAIDGEDALDRIAQFAYDVILTDLRMPGMGGEQLLERLSEQRPELVDRVIIMTGHVARDDEELAALHPDIPLIEKPFALRDMQRLIEEHATRAHAD